MINVLSIGSAARQVLVQNQEARWMGHSSRGIFLCAASQWVLYLTHEPHRGPLTLNLDRMTDSLQERQGEPAEIHPEGIWFAKSRVWLSLQGAEEWSPLPCPPVYLSPGEMQAHLEAVSQQIRAPTGPFLADLERSLPLALQQQQAGQAAALLARCLGSGPGLTPSGDDLAAGMLLVLNRWHHVLLPGFPLSELNDRLVQQARTNTTTLSAHLIECAAQGLADERLVAGLDGLVTGTPDAKRCAAWFNSWGNTSGGMAFAGMRLALSSQPGQTVSGLTRL
jgi:hypothetical protein